MFEPRAIRYGNFRVRLLCSLAAAMAVVALSDLGIFQPVESQIRRSLMAGYQYGTQSVPPWADGAIIAAVCLAAGALRIEQPLAMIAYGCGLAFIYSLIASIVLLASDVLLPSGAALTGIAATTAALETLAWGDERFRRRHLERLEIAKQQFTDMLVHDLRKRMTSILMSLSVLELRVDTAQPRIAELMSTIRISAERMLLLIGNLLDIRKIEEGRLTLHPESVSLRAVVKESLDEHRAAFDLAGVQPRITSGGDMSVRVDRSLFSRVMANLLWNAIQHAPSGTLISIDFGRTSPNRARVAVGNAGDAISTEDMEPLRTALQSGSPELADLSVDATGLGLSFCKLAVEAHGGTISLTSPRPDSPDGVEVAIHLPG